MKYRNRKDGDSGGAKCTGDNRVTVRSAGGFVEGRRSRPSLGSVTLLALAGVALLVAACGSSSNTAATSKTAGSGPGTTSSGTGSASSGGSGSNTLLSQLKALEAQPSFKAPGPAFDAKKLAGSTFAAVNCDPAVAPPTQAIQGSAQAGKAVGIDVKVLNISGMDNVTSAVQTMDQAINLKPKAIIATCAPQLIAAPLQTAKKDGIPVVIEDVVPPNASAPGQGAGPLVFGVSSEPFALQGTILAEEIAANGPKNAEVGFISANLISGSPVLEASFKSGLAKYCPGCKLVATPNVDPTNWVTQVPSTVTSMLTAHPNLNYLVPVMDGMDPFVLQGLKSGGSGRNVKVITTQGTTGTPLSDVQSGTFFSDVGISNFWVGWQGMDQAMRGALGLPPDTHLTMPERYVTTSSLSGIDVTNDSAVYGTSYVTGFKKLWGLG